MKFFSSFFLSLILTLVATVSGGKDLPKIAVWDLVAGNITPSYAQDLTSILVSEITKLGKYEVYSQENVRTLAGWTAERMTLGCTDTKCLTALGQMDISKLISGRVGRIGNTYSISLHLFDTQKVRSENSVSNECRSEDELIPLVRQAVSKLLGEKIESTFDEEKVLLKKEATSWIEGKQGIERVENGEIDWTQRIIHAKGSGSPPKTARSVREARLITEQRALADATSKLLEVIKRIRVNPATVVGEYIVRNDQIRFKIEDLVHSSATKVIHTRYFTDGAVEVTVAFYMSEEFLALMDRVGKNLQ